MFGLLLFNFVNVVKHRIDVKYFIKGHNLVDIREFPLNIVSQSGLIYEVIRICNNKPLFLNEHLYRLRNSLKIKLLPLLPLNIISDLFMKLVNANNVDEGNVKISIAYDDNLKATPYLYFIPHRYPNLLQLKNGIETRLQFDTRKFPQVKMADWNIRGKANKIIDSEGVYETLLVNSQREITEGSRSNVFFVSGNELITAPNSAVLSGVTRDKVIELAELLNIKISYKSMPIDDLHSVDASFLSGTSPGVLQIHFIDDIEFEINNSIYLKLFKAYNEISKVSNLS